MSTLNPTFLKKKPIERFFEFLDGIAIGKQAIVKGYTPSTLRNYVGRYCKETYIIETKSAIGYKIVDTKAGVAVKLYEKRKKVK